MSLLAKETAAASKRIVWLDAAKGLLILLVVLGHMTTSRGLTNYLSSFYMPAFFMLSGFTVKEELTTSLKTYLCRRARALLGPYLLFSICWIAFQTIKSYVFSSDFSLVSGLTSIFLPYSGRPGISVYIYWFLPCMFLAQAAFALIRYLPNKQKLFGVLLWIGYCVIGVAFDRGHLLACAALATVFIGIGYAAKKFEIMNAPLRAAMFAGGGQLYTPCAIG